MQNIPFASVKKKATPFIQFAGSFAIGLAGMGITQLFPAYKTEAYFAALVSVIFFCLVNIVVSLMFDSFLRYTVLSFYLFLLLLVGLFFIAKQLSGISIWDRYEYKMMAVTVILFYILSSLVVRVMLFFYEAAKKY